MPESGTSAAFEMSHKAREADGILACSGTWYAPPRWRDVHWNSTHRLPTEQVEAAFDQLVRIFPPGHAQRLFLEDPNSDAAGALRWPNPLLAAQDTGLRLGLHAADVGLMDQSPLPPLVSKLRHADQFRGARFELAIWAAFERSKQPYVHESRRTDGGTLDLRWDTSSGPVDIEVKTVSDVDNSANARLAYRIVQTVEAEAQRAGHYVAVGMEWRSEEIPTARARRRKFEHELEVDLAKLRSEAQRAFASRMHLDFTSSRLFRCLAKPFPNSCGSYPVPPLPDWQEALRVVRNAVRQVVDEQASEERPFAIVLHVPPTISTDALQDRITAYAEGHRIRTDWFLGCLVARTVPCGGQDLCIVPSLFVPLPATGREGDQPVLQELADVLNQTALQRHFLLDHMRADACPFQQSSVSTS